MENSFFITYEQRCSTISISGRNTCFAFICTKFAAAVSRTGTLFHLEVPSAEAISDWVVRGNSREWATYSNSFTSLAYLHHHTQVNFNGKSHQMKQNKRPRTVPLHRS